MSRWSRRRRFDTQIVEYRRPARMAAGSALACALTDMLRDGLSMVYSFSIREDARSLGYLHDPGSHREARSP